MLVFIQHIHSATTQVQLLSLSSKTLPAQAGPRTRNPGWIVVGFQRLLIADNPAHDNTVVDTYRYRRDGSTLRGMAHVYPAR